tara:strand:- start:2544 stop:3692 length:1149 start_codon:yes stop_codon:yes gene_type:complete
MKKILFRKLILDYLIFFTIALLSATIVVWVFQAVNFLDIMIEDGRDYLTYINYSLLNFPKILSRLFPFVLFFSLFYVTAKYELSNELLIYWNFGVNKIEIVSLVIKFSVFLLLIQLFFTTFLVPNSQDLARSFLRTSEVNFFSNFIKPQKFNDTIKGVTIFSERKDDEGNLYNLYLKKELGQNHFQITYGKRGVFKDINGTSILVLYDGETITAKDNQVTNISFSKSDFLLKNLETNTTTYKKTQEISTTNLFRCIYFIYFLKLNNDSLLDKSIKNCKLDNTENILKEFYKRFIIPLYIPILCLISLLLITLSKENINYTKLRIITFSFGLLIIIFSETTIRLISKILTNNIIVLLLPIIIFLFLYLYFLLKFKTRKTFPKL